MSRSWFSRTVWLLALISLLTDISSEMLYPVMPLYLTAAGFSGFLIGVLEGLADVTSGLAKMYFGAHSDARGQRTRYVRLGYFLSALGKPLLALWAHPAWIFFSRLLDRLGKGMRTGPRDALLSEQAHHQNRGSVFGFHRAMDTAGAVIGPALALLYLQYWPEQYRPLFVLALIPALAAVVLTLLLQEIRRPSRTLLPWWQGLTYWQRAPGSYRRLLLPLMLFAAVRTTDFFLLMRIQQISGSDNLVIIAYILYNLAYAALAYPLGRLADGWGLKNMLCLGLVVYAFVFATMASTQSTFTALFLLLLYGMYAAATESTARALIGRLVPNEQAASAMGFYAGIQSLGLLVGGAITGLLWTTWSPVAALLLSATGACLSMLLLLLQRIEAE